MIGMAGRAKTLVAAAMVVGLATMLTANAGSAGAATSTRHRLGAKLFGSELHYRSGATRIDAPISGLTASRRSPPSMLSAVAHVKNRYLHMLGAPRAGRTSAPNVTGVVISGTYNVVRMPRTATESAIVIACPGSSSFGFFCGTEARPAWGAYTHPKRGSPSTGSYSFGRIPRSATGWKVGIILLDGYSNAGYYPASAGALVAVKGSTKAVKRAVSMSFVTPEVLSTFHVAGAPRGYEFEFDAVICPSSVTADQLQFFEENGNCGIAQGFGIQHIGIYATPGRWTVRYLYQPINGTVEMLAPADVVTKDFTVNGPHLVLNTLSTRSIVNMATPYLKPSVAGAIDTSSLSQNFYAVLLIVDATTDVAVAEVYVESFNGPTVFNLFLDPGTYAAYTEVQTPFAQDPYATVVATQVVLTKLGADFDVGLSDLTHGLNDSVARPALSVSSNVAVSGLPDLANASGWDNVQPFSFVQICPGATFSLECAGGYPVSPSKLLGGTFHLYATTGVISAGFVYTDLAGNVVIGPAVTSPASSSERTFMLTATYQMPSFWGNVTVSGDNDFQIFDMWIQACPASRPFNVSCAGGVSQPVNNFYSTFPPASGSFKVGYAIDLPPGTWRFAAVGSTFDSNAPLQLGPAVGVTVATTYPDIDLTARG